MIPFIGFVTDSEIVADYTALIHDVSGHSLCIECDDEDCRDWRRAARQQAPVELKIPRFIKIEDSRE